MTALGQAEQHRAERAEGPTWPPEFASIVREHQAMVFSLAWHYLHDRSMAEDVAQEVFLQLHQNLDSIESPLHLGYWLRKVASQRAIDAGRRRKRRPQLSLEGVPEPSVAARTGDPMLGGALRRLIAALPESARMVVVLRYQEDLEPTEIAGLLDMPVGTVKSQLHRALAFLRDKMSREKPARQRGKFQ